MIQSEPIDIPSDEVKLIIGGEVMATINRDEMPHVWTGNSIDLIKLLSELPSFEKQEIDDNHFPVCSACARSEGSSLPNKHERGSNE